MNLSTRTANVLGAGVCALLIAYAYYLQYHDGLEPCPLCIFQRVAFVVLGAVFFIAALHDARRIGARVYAILIGLVALSGIGLAGRHLYIQSQPQGSVPACGATLDYLMDVFPVTYVIRKVLTGSGECSKVDWTFLGVSMPGWVLAAFVLLGAWGIAKNWHRT
jgi:protein dithiol:quinone oxidoreductase